MIAPDPSVILRPAGRHLMIHGRVQGVGYRLAMQRQARALGLGGWVRNRGDGAVEAEIFGSDVSMAAMLAWVRQGPPGAIVAQVEVAEALTVRGGTDFKVEADY